MAASRRLLDALSAAAVAVLALAAFAVDQPLDTRGALSLLGEALDVAHGRLPLTGTTAGNGLGSTFGLGAIGALVPLSQNRVLLAASVAAVACALLLAYVAAADRDARAGRVLRAVAVVAVLSLATARPASFSPSDGAWALLPAYGALALGLDRRPGAVLGGLAIAWSPLAAAVVLAALLGSGPRRDIRTVCSVAAATVVALVAAAAVADGALPALGELARALVVPISADDGPRGLLVVVLLAALALAWFARPDVSPHRRALAPAATALAIIGLLGASELTCVHALALAVAAAPRVDARRALALAVVPLVVLAAASPAAARWKRSALYDLMPHGALARLGLGPHVGGSLRYDLDVLRGRGVTDRRFVDAIPGDGAVDALGGAPATTSLTAITGRPLRFRLGDPTRAHLPSFLADDADRTIAALPAGTRFVVPTPWLAAVTGGQRITPPSPAGDVFERLAAARVLRRLGGQQDVTLIAVGARR